MANPRIEIPMDEFNSEGRLSNVGVWATIFSALADLNDTQNEQARPTLFHIVSR